MGSNSFRRRLQVGRGGYGFRYWWCHTVLLLVLGLLCGCGRAEQTSDKFSPAPLPSAATTPSQTTPVPTPQIKPTPTPDAARLIPSVTAAYLFTSVAISRNQSRASATTRALLALTPEPTILPDKSGRYLRDVWPASAQQAAPSTHLYLRRFAGDFDPDTFWEVRLSDAHSRRLPAVEQNGVDKSG